MYWEREYSKRRFKEVDSKMPWILRRLAHHVSYARGLYFLGLMMLLLLWALGTFG